MTNNNDTEQEKLVKAAEDLLRMEQITSTQWRVLSGKLADFAINYTAKLRAEQEWTVIRTMDDLPKKGFYFFHHTKQGPDIGHIPEGGGFRFILFKGQSLSWNQFDAFCSIYLPEYLPSDGGE